ncbi:MAG: hypothetical protein R3F11_03710 [Verrucomicrobiales bacterium]
MSWRGSLADGGTPGGSDATTFSGAPDEFAAYAFPGGAASFSQAGGETTLQFQINPAAEDLRYHPQVSTDNMATWQQGAAAFEFLGESRAPDGSVTWQFKALDLTGFDAVFFRAAAESR